MRKRSWAVALGAAAVLLAGCGQSGFQYLESDDQHVFAKIPDDWAVISQGVVDFELLPQDQTQMRLLPGDDILPWQARFTADESGVVSASDVTGQIDVQPVDSRLRASLSLDAFGGPPEGGEQIGAVRDVTLGELDGFRIRFARGDDDPLITERMVLMDARRTIVYSLEASCVESCFERNEAIIDEIITTFTVEP